MAEQYKRFTSKNIQWAICFDRSTKHSSTHVIEIIHEIALSMQARKQQQVNQKKNKTYNFRQYYSTDDFVNVR